MKYRFRTLAICALAATTTLSFADLKIVTHMTLSMPMSGSPKGQDITTYYRNGVMRVETSPSAIVLINSKTNQKVLIDPTTKTYSDLATGELTPQQKEMMKKADVKITTHLKPTNEKMTIAGKAAKKYLITILITMNLPGEKDKPSPGTMKMNMTMDQWTTTAIKEKYSIKDMMQSTMQMLKALSSMGNTSSLMREFGKMKGFPLNNSTDIAIQMLPSKTAPKPPTGTPMTMNGSIKTEVKSLTEAPLKADLFKVPAGYKKSATKAKMPVSMGMG